MHTVLFLSAAVIYCAEEIRHYEPTDVKFFVERIRGFSGKLMLGFFKKNFSEYFPPFSLVHLKISNENNENCPQK